MAFDCIFRELAFEIESEGRKLGVRLDGEAELSIFNFLPSATKESGISPLMEDDRAERLGVSPWSLALSVSPWRNWNISRPELEKRTMRVCGECQFLFVPQQVG